MAKRTCSVDGCEGPCFGHGLCSKHYQRKRRTGTTDEAPDLCKRGLHGFTPENTYVDPLGKRVCKPCRNEQIRQREKPPCSVEGCDKGAVKRGWCPMHYKRWLEAGDPGDAEPKRHAPGELHCLVGGCARGDYYAKGFCSIHYQRWWRIGATDLPPQPDHPETCTIPGCSSKYLSADLCRKHYLRVWRTGSPDDRVPVTHCAKGHEFTPDNTRVYSGKRYCRLCMAARSASRREWMAAAEYVDYGVVVEIHGMICHICRLDIASMDDVHIDHVIPRARGGSHTYENVRPAHARCNLRKHVKLMEELAA